jgi:hypothetical protein
MEKDISSTDFIIKIIFFCNANGHIFNISKNFKTSEALNGLHIPYALFGGTLVV